MARRKYCEPSFKQGLEALKQKGTTEGERKRGNVPLTCGPSAICLVCFPKKRVWHLNIPYVCVREERKRGGTLLYDWVGLFLATPDQQHNAHEISPGEPGPLWSLYTVKRFPTS